MERVGHTTVTDAPSSFLGDGPPLNFFLQRKINSDWTHRKLSTTDLLFVFLSIRSFLFFLTSSFLFSFQVVSCAGLHSFCPRVQCGWHCKSPSCICNMCVFLSCIIVCDRRARLSSCSRVSRIHRHGHWLS